jgi:hypothetical protein
VSPAACCRRRSAEADADADACCCLLLPACRRRHRLWNQNPVSKPNEDALNKSAGNECAKGIGTSLSTKVQAMSDNGGVAAQQASAVCSAACVAGF